MKCCQLVYPDCYSVRLADRLVAEASDHCFVACSGFDFADAVALLSFAAEVLADLQDVVFVPARFHAARYLLSEVCFDLDFVYW